MRSSVLTEIVSATDSRVRTSDGRILTDLMNGFGTVFLGHCHPVITAGLRQQLDRAWALGRCVTPAHAQADQQVRAMLPTEFAPAGMYSTGMEAAEYALRVAVAHTGRSEFAAFARSMHGKSAVTAALCWDNAPLPSRSVHSLPFVDRAPESEILERLTHVLRSGRIAAVFVEPIQGSNGAHEAGHEFLEGVIALCREHGALCVFDELLTGLYRTGTRFYMDMLGEKPDILLFAKNMANGFPVSCVAVRNGIGVGAETLPGSTFSGNPLAAAAVAATLAVMRAEPMQEKVGRIDATIRRGLGGADASITLRGRGALWCLEISEPERMERALQRMQAGDLLISSYGRFVRLLPAATIDPAELERACDVIADACGIRSG